MLIQDKKKKEGIVLLVVNGNEVYELNMDCMQKSGQHAMEINKKRAPLRQNVIENKIDIRQLTGKGIGVALLDSGIYEHPDLKKQIGVFIDMTSNRKTPYDNNGHGTHVAGILAGDGTMSQGRIKGIAPGVSLIVVKVLDKNGKGKLAQMLDGMQWILENKKKYDIRIVNISIGATVQSQIDKQEEELLMKFVNGLWDAGLVVCIAAGNEGGAQYRITTPGTNRKAITVGAYDDAYMWDQNGRYYQNYSSRGPTIQCVCKPEIVAPGTNIVGTNAMKERSDKPYTIKSGTSMSTAIVSGAIALLLEGYPQMKNWEVKLRLRERAQDLGMEQNHQGWGALNIERLLAKE